jgi:hypothetical protein
MDSYFLGEAGDDEVVKAGQTWEPDTDRDYTYDEVQLN